MCRQNQLPFLVALLFAAKVGFRVAEFQWLLFGRELELPKAHFRPNPDIQVLWKQWDGPLLT
jgi:hypothetical protein